MKRIIFISLLSLIFICVNAQRSAKTWINDENNASRNKSEIKDGWSVNQKTRSLENKTNRAGNDFSYRTENENNIYEFPANRHSGNSVNGNNESGNNDRNITEKIIRNKTDLHKNINSERYPSYKNRTFNSANRRGRNSINKSVNHHERNTNQTQYKRRIHPEVVHVINPGTLEFRRIYFPYRPPVNIQVIWTHRMYRDYVLIYPEYRYWHYPIGYRILNVSAYDAIYYAGEVVNIFGRVHEAWYCWQTDEYFLYLGANYPYHNFSVIIPGCKARQFSRRPDTFFTGRDIWVTGLISLYEGKPEMMIKHKNQIHLY